MLSPADMVLSRREREVAELVAQGLTNYAIAKRLFLSERTIEGHIEHAFNKLGLNSRTQLAMWIRASGARDEEAPPTAAVFPAQLTSFIGRQDDLAALEALLAGSRVITLTGIGGSGKTRLALELARRLQTKGGRTVWPVDMSAVGDPALLAQTLAASLGISEPDSSREALVARFRGLSGVILLDNCEHVAAPCAELVASMAAECPKIHFLITSREPIHVSGEATWRVQPLPVPARNATLEQVAQSESVKLFVERVRLAVPDFGIDQSNTDAVGELCRRLDGLPLALELAAARVGVLSPAQILERLDHRFSLLGDGGQPRPARQQTLRATMEWSYELLSEPEQIMFRRLAVFTGTFNLDAVVAVCAIEPLRSEAVIGIIGRLIDRSLVSATGAVRAAIRYRQLETTRAYAADLLAADTRAAEIADRHARLFTSIAIEAGRRLGGPDAGDWISLVAEEMDNLRAALLWTIKNDHGLALEMCASLAGYWDFHGWLSEGRHWLERALQVSDAERSPAYAAALTSAGMLAYRQGDYVWARRFHELSIKSAEAMGNHAVTARALAGLGDVLVETGEPDAAMVRYEASLDLYRTENDVLSAARGLSRLGGVYNRKGDFETSERYYRESFEAFRQLGDRVGIANQLFSIGATRLFAMKFQSGRNYLGESLALRRELGDALGVSWSSGLIAYADIRLGNHHAACEPLADGLKGCNGAGDLRGLSIALDIALGLFLDAGLYAAVVRTHSAAANIRKAGGFEGLPWIAQIAQEWVSRARAELAPDEVEHQEFLGEAMTPQSAVRFALQQIDSIAATPRPDSQLTRREREVAKHVADGLTNREIALHMRISERTVDSHLQHTMGKLGFKSRAQVAAWHARNNTRVTGG